MNEAPNLYAPHAEIWTALAGGTYKVQLSTTRPPGKCELHGLVTVSVMP